MLFVLQYLHSSNFLGTYWQLGLLPVMFNALSCFFFFFYEKDLTVNSSNEAAKWICVFTNPKKGKIFFQNNIV